MTTTEFMIEIERARWPWSIKEREMRFNIFIEKKPSDYDLHYLCLVLR